MPTAQPQPPAYPYWSPSHAPFSSASPVDIDIDVEMMNADPLSHFLSPTAPPHDNPLLDDDEDYFIFDLDAGIENSRSPRRAARQSVVSPSSLDYFRRHGSGTGAGTGMGVTSPLGRSPSSWSSASTASDTDEDEGHGHGRNGFFARFAPPQPQPLSSCGPGVHGVQGTDRARSRHERKFTQAHHPVSPSLSSLPPSHAITRSRVSSLASAGGNYPYRESPVGSPRSPTTTSWRGPGPDVWSITEEAEEESCVSSVVVGGSGKPKKKVRFVLPTREY